MRPADRAWLALVTGILVYEFRGEELLSEAMDRYRKRSPYVMSTVIIYIAMHLLRWWPQRVDPLHRLATKMGR